MRRFFFMWTAARQFVVLLALSTTMSGMVNLGQNCFVNALMQCFSVNQSMVNALEVHSRHHDTATGKYNISEIFNRRLQCETSPRDFSRQKLLKKIPKIMFQKRIGDVCYVLYTSSWYYSDPRYLQL